MAAKKKATKKATKAQVSKKKASEKQPAEKQPAETRSAEKQASKSQGAPTQVDRKLAKRTLYASASEVEKEDVEKLLGRQREFEGKLEELPGRFRKLINQLRLLFELIGDYWSGRYMKVPWLSITVAAGAVIYFINPIDLIPDVIPVIGYLDDAMIVGLAIAALQDDLLTYCQWKGYDPARYF